MAYRKPGTPEEGFMKLLKTVALLISLSAVLAALACTQEVVKEVPVTEVVTQEVIREVPVEKIVEVEKETVRTIEVEKPVEVVKEVVREVQVPGETVVVEVPKEVVREVVVEVPKEVVKEVVVTKEVVKEVPKEVVVKETVVKEVEKVVFRDPRMRGTLRVTDIQKQHLDAAAAGGANGWPNTHIKESTFQLNAQYDPRPELVESWRTSADGLKWTFTLRNGVKFHNGDPLTAEDVVGSIKRVEDHPGMISTLIKDHQSGDYDGNWRAVDSLTYEMTLDKFSTFVLSSMTQPTITGQFIVPRSEWSLPVTEVNNNAVGTGSFKLDQWIPGDRVIVSRYEDYQSPPGPPSWQAGRKVAFADKVEFIVVPDVAAQVAALKSGQLDIISTPFGGDTADQMKDDPNIIIHTVKFGTARMSIWPKHSGEIFDDVRARQALKLALPSERIMTAAYGSSSYWRTCASMWTCDTFWESDVDTEDYNVQDLDRARALIEEAGLVGAEVLMPVRSLPLVADPSRIVREVLEDLGMVVIWEDLATGAWVERVINEGKWDLFVTTTSGFKDPFIGNSVHFKKMGWIHDYADETNEMTENLNRLFSENLTREEQKMVTDQVQSVFLRDLPLVPLGEGFKNLAVRTHIKGYIPHEMVPMYNLWIEKD